MPQAIVCALEATSYEDAIRNAVSLGGDSDPLACMAGGIAEARFGVPENLRKTAQKYVDINISKVITDFYSKVR